MADEGQTNFLRSILLLIEGGSYISRAILNRESTKTGRDIDSLLGDFKTKLKHEFHGKQYQKLFPDTGDKTDINRWDLQLLIGVICIVFRKSISRSEKKDLLVIKQLRNDVFMHSACASLDEEKYEDVIEQLEDSLNGLASTFEKSVQDVCFSFIKNFKSGSLDALRPSIAALNGLSQTTQRKFTVGVSTVLAVDGPSKYWTELCEDILEKILNAAISGNESDEPENIRTKVTRMLEYLLANADIVFQRCMRACIILKFECNSYEDMLYLLNKLDSWEHRYHLNKVSNALTKEHKLHGLLTITSRVTTECLHSILIQRIKMLHDEEIGDDVLEVTSHTNNEDKDEDKEMYPKQDSDGIVSLAEDVRKPLKLGLECKSKEGLMHMLNLFKGNELQVHLKDVADSLSEHVRKKVTLKTSLNIEDFMSAFEEAVIAERYEDRQLMTFIFRPADISKNTQQQSEETEYIIKRHLREHCIEDERPEVYEIPPEESIAVSTGEGIANIDCLEYYFKRRKNGESSESSKEVGMGIKRKRSGIESEPKEEIKRLGVEDSDEQKQKAYEKAKSESSESTKEECEGIKSKLSNIEIQLSEQNKEIKRLGLEDSDEQKQQAYQKAKLEWRNKIIQEYHKTVLKVPAMPLLPDETCEFSQIYVRPPIVTEVKDEKGGTNEKEIESMSEIFTKNGVPLKSIYVVGDAGTGKSSFCKYLVNCWCMAHSEGQSKDDKFDGVIEMKKFEFMFLISLRHNQSKDSIHEMLKNQYDIDILGTLLEKDSAKIIILLDGLDEWSSEGKTYSQFQTIGLPKQDSYKDYTIVTTSRPWKLHTLRIRDTEIQQMLKLKGFDYKSENEMIKRTVFNINSRKGESKDINDCSRKLQEKSLRSLKQVPIMLQQLICLWFDGHLDKTSRCDVSTEMLELFFTWNDDKIVGTNLRNIEGSQNMELPECFTDKEMCDLNSHLIYDISRLAYETLFNCPKDKSLTFDISIFRKLKISDEIREGCLKLGLLTNDRCPSLSVSKRPKSMFSFIHKSVQEFLAAVNIAINFITKMRSLDNLDDTDLQIESIKLIKEVFKNCSTINGILELSNVFIMLCGLEPRLAKFMSRYIYDIVKEDPLVKRYRRTLDSYIRLYYSDYSCISDIQDLIFDSMKECNACPVETSPTFYIGDLYIHHRNEYCDIVCSSFDQQQITPDFIHSIYVHKINIENVIFSKYLPKFKHLEKINIDSDLLMSISTENVDIRIYEVNKSVAETIKINASSLKSLSLSLHYNDSLYKEVLCLLPSMINLVAIKMTGMIMSHDTTRFCEYLEGTSQLEQIHIDIKCKCRNQYDVDLSKHQQLQHLNLSCSTCIFVTDIDTVNLEVFICWNIKSTNYIKIFDCLMKCDNLKELELCVDNDMKSQSFHTSITKRLVSLLPLLHNLSKLVLHDFRLTDNIIQVPSGMKSLKSIDLNDVTMSLTTWRKFVDSLPSIPHTVDVRLFDCFITGDGEEFNVDWLSLLERVVVRDKRNEAIQYVKDRKHLFIVNDGYSRYFVFSTKSNMKDT